MMYKGMSLERPESYTSLSMMTVDIEPLFRKKLKSDIKDKYELRAFD